MSTSIKNLASIKDLPDVSFIENKTLDDVQAEMVADYQEKYREMTGREIRLRRADPETLKLYAVSVQIYHLYLHVDKSGKMDLLKYAYSSFLDNLGALRGVDRNPAIPASVTVRFTLSAVQPSAITIPAGTRVSDGEEYFAVGRTMEIAAGETYADALCTCQKPGKAGNGILAGTINVLVDPIAYIEKVESLDVSSGGADVEDDDNFAYRIYLAPSSYSVAGPDDAYKYHTKSFSAAIGDVDVLSPVPGRVEVRFLLTDGTLPSEGMCEEVLQHLSQKDIRPLTDHVSVSAPGEQEFSIDIAYCINKSDIDKAVSIQTLVANAVREYIEWQTNTISRDINPSVLTKYVIAAGAKRIEIASPAYQKVQRGYVARVSGISVTYRGVEDD